MNHLTRRGSIVSALALASVALGSAPGSSAQQQASLTGNGFTLAGTAHASPATAILSAEGLTLVGTLSTRGVSADVAEPFGVLDAQDKARFMALFSAGDLKADLTEPWGQVDSSDLSEFVRRYESGQP